MDASNQTNKEAPKSAEGKDAKANRRQRKGSKHGGGYHHKRNMPHRPGSAPPVAQNYQQRMAIYIPHRTMHHSGGVQQGSSGYMAPRGSGFGGYPNPYATYQQQMYMARHQFARQMVNTRPPLTRPDGTRSSSNANVTTRKSTAVAITTADGEEIEGIEELRRKKEREMKEAEEKAKADREKAEAAAAAAAAAAKFEKKKIVKSDPKEDSETSKTDKKGEEPVLHPLATKSVNKSAAAAELRALVGLKDSASRNDGKDATVNDPVETTADADPDATRKSKEEEESKRIAAEKRAKELEEERTHYEERRKMELELKRRKEEAAAKRKAEQASKQTKNTDDDEWHVVSNVKTSDMDNDSGDALASRIANLSIRAMKTAGKVVFSMESLRAYRASPKCADRPSKLAPIDKITSVSFGSVGGSNLSDRGSNSQRGRGSGGGSFTRNLGFSRSSEHGSHGNRFRGNPRREFEGGSHMSFRLNSKRSGGANSNTRSSWTRGMKQPEPVRRDSDKSSYHKQRRRNDRYQDSAPLGDYKPKKSANAWSREKIKATDPNEKKLRICRDQLNKLTPEKFAKISKNILEVDIDNLIVFKGLIYAIFDTALVQPVYSEMYAKLCALVSAKSDSTFAKKITKIVKLENGKFKFDVGDSNVVSPEFETEEAAMKSGVKISSFRRVLLTKCQEEFETKIDWNAFAKDIDWDALNEDETKEKKREVDYKISQAKKRMLGNIKFIGELFMKKMLTANIMCHCITSCLQSKQEEYIESVCKLLTVVGKRLDSGSSKKYVDRYFAHLAKLSKQKEISTRIRFMIANTIELRGREWKPRRDEKAPTTIAQVRQQAAQEDVLKARRSHKIRNESSADRRDRDGSRNRGGKFMPVAYSRSYSSGSTSGRSQDARTKTLGSRRSDGSNSMKFRTESDKAQTRRSQKMTGTSASTSPSMSPSEFKKKCKATLAEFKRIRDTNEVKECLMEYGQKDNSAFITEALNLIVDTGSRDQAVRDSIAKLIADLSSSVLTVRDILAGIGSFVEFIDDICIDIPLAPAFVANFFANVLCACNDKITLGALFQQFKNETIESGAAKRVLSKTLAALAKSCDEAKIGAWIKKDQVALASVLKDVSISAFLESSGLGAIAKHV